ncbi:Cof-type HAD-IIB family hydrolase [Aerococcus sp. 1KP-2016]|uniref:Cof-type HAD-IIB family hydrolase n=1 Tax=Aerococcus sp. 1KP-2016 TaxID=1981982 RepID=UPI000B98A28B|nr:Cof-type HAD-IIB family hydrolase [Aerococcus sp. 1KP-2016]OYQ67904.1 haloacid dehalogenase [Aerococcus sp. 1KP-2016]
MIELIVSDMDGTLLDENMEIPQANIDAIMQTYNMGIPFVVCTGRNYTEAKVKLDEAGIRCPIIGLNGSILFDRNGQVEYEVDIDKETALAILNKGYEVGYYMEAMTSKNVYSSSLEQRIVGITELIQSLNPDMSVEEARTRATQSNEVTTIDFRDDLRTLITEEGQDIIKITFVDVDPENTIKPLGEEIKAAYPDTHVTSSFKYNIEINHADGTKGIAVTKYCQEHGYNIENVVTVGDNFNDLSMLKVAGYSFAMANAEQGVKDVAKYETTTNYNAGVANAIHHALELAGAKN